MKTNGILHRPVRGLLHLIDANVIDDKVRIEKLPGLLGDIGHFLKAVNSFVPEPLIDLVPPEGLHAVL